VPGTEVQPRPGQNAYLTLDTELQQQVEEILAAGITKSKAKSGSRTSKLKSLLDHMREKGGFSYQPVLEKHATAAGFIVSPYAKRSKIIPNEEITEKDLTDYVDDNWDLLQQEDKYFGSWFNQEDGNIYLDVSIPVESLEEANALGVKHEQREFYDLKNDKSIKTVWPKGQTPKFHD